MDRPRTERLCVFCGSALGARPIYAQAATALGEALAARRVGLVYGGASVGMMGVLADAVLAAGGEAVGVIPQSLLDREVAHHGLTEQHVVPTLSVRKQRMADLSAAFLAIPGGYGTLDELFEVLTWAQLGLHDKPIGIWNLEGFFDGLLAGLDHASHEGLLQPTERARLIVEAELDPLLDRLVGPRARVSSGRNP
jgi:uncharacterized protein (TIGR00730 family)